VAKNARSWLGKLWQSLNLKVDTRGKTHRKRPGVQPALEMLENRCVPAGLGTVQGIAFVDANTNGNFDSGEAPIPGVVITLKGTNAGLTGNTNIDRTTTTDASGAYVFTTVPVGDYTLASGNVPGVTNGAGQTAPVSIVADGQTVFNNFDYAGGVAPTSFSMRQFLTNSTAGDLPYNAAGAGSAIADHAPIVSTAVTPVVTTAGAIDNTVIDLAGNFSDADFTNSQITFNIIDGTTPRTVTMDLFDAAAPRTVTNFFDYVTSGKYDESIFHRLTTVAGDGLGILQGGALAYPDNDPTNLITIPIGDKVPNEFSATRSNTAGTIAMAQTTGNINSATSQFFFNNVSNAASLDSQKFSVFGTVADDASMTTLTTMAATTTTNLSGGIFAAAHPTALIDDFPNHNYAGTKDTFDNDAVAANYITIDNITINKRDEFLTYSLVGANGGANAAFVTVTLTNEFLTIDPLAAGVTTVTVKATDRFGASVTTTINVTVN